MTVLERCGIQSHCVRPSMHQTRSRVHFRRVVGRPEAWRHVSWRSSGGGSLSWNGRKTVTARRTAVYAAGSSIDSSPILRIIVPAIVAASVALPLSAGAAEDLPPNLIDFFNTWLVQIEELGPWGPVLFVLTVTSAELIPLFPTQPLALAGGLLFGATKGGLCVWVAANLAALLAFSLSKGVGRSLAERVIAAEMGSERAEGEAGPLERVQRAIESGQLWQQFTAVLLLRLTPVVPFSASNYVLGLTPLDARAFFCATFVGMLVWSAVFASLGGAGRQLLDGGEDLESVFSGLVDQASTYTNAAGMLILAVGGVALLFALARRLSDADDHSEVVDPPREDGSWLGESPSVETSVMETRSKAKAANRSE